MNKEAALPLSGLSLVSLIPNLSQSVQETLPQELKEQPELFNLVSEYCELAYKSVLLDFDIERISEIYELALYDEDLNSWLKRIDASIDPLFINLRQQDKISLQDFISEMKSTSSEDMTVEKLQILAEKLHFTDCFLKSYIYFQGKEYSRQLICQTPYCSIFVICWKPNQFSQPHLHANDFTVIQVYRGTLTYTVFDEINEVYIHEGREGRQLKYLKKEEHQFKQNSWLSIENGQVHQLANTSSSNLVTIHFRYFKKPLLREDKE